MTDGAPDGTGSADVAAATDPPLAGSTELDADDSATASPTGGSSLATDGGVDAAVTEATDPAGSEQAGSEQAGSEPAGGESAGDESAEDFDPIGTVVLIAIYMAIVIGMWIFTYFVEFLGRGVTIVG